MLYLSNYGSRTFRNCRRKYFLRHVRRIKRIISVDKPAANYGILWHEILVRWFIEKYLGGLDQFTRTVVASELDTLKAYAQLRGYVERWTEMPICSLHEQSFLVPIRNPDTGWKSRTYSQYGILDMLALEENGEIWLYEHKAVSDTTDYVDKVYSDSQITGYVSALKDMGIDVTGVVYDLALKPRIKQKQSESKLDYFNRLLEWHQQPHAYHREKVYVSDRQIADWKKDLWLVTQDILRCHRTNKWMRNTDRCFDYFSRCEYLPLCQNGTPEVLVNAEYETRE